MAGDISRQNGKKGGRKKASHTVTTEAGRAFVVATIARNLKPLIDAMVEKALKGDTQAFKELFDRGWGKPQQAIDHTSKGERVEGNTIILADFRDEANGQ